MGIVPFHGDPPNVKMINIVRISFPNISQGFTSQQRLMFDPSCLQNIKSPKYLAYYWWLFSFSKGPLK